MTPTQLFNSYVNTGSTTLDKERELIAATQAGCNESCGELLTQYAPLLKKYASQAPNQVEREEVQGVLMLGFMEAVNDFDPDEHSNLAATLPQHLRRALSEIGVTASSFTIPSRSLSRWLSILKKADGDIYKAINLAPQFGMSRETFMAIHSALRNTNSLDAVLSAGPYLTRSLHVPTEEPIGESDNELVDQVFDLRGDKNDLSDREATILRYAYGWYSYGEQLTDDAVGHKLGLSRPSVQRLRQVALEKARRRLGLE